MSMPLETDPLPAPVEPDDTSLEPHGWGGPLPRTEWSPVHEQVAELARTRPTDLAVRSGDRAISYRALDAWAGRIAARLAERGVGPGSRVGLLTEPSTAMVAAVLGVLRSGAAYVPVDLSHPDRRVAQILTDAQVTAAVVTGAATRLARLDLPLVRAEDEADGPQDAAAAADPATAQGAAASVTATDPAYLIYTSGSTGEPKGVLVEHGQLAASTLARRLVYPGASVFLLVSPLAFDSSVAGLWGTLTAGGHLVVATAQEVRDPEQLLDLIERHQVTRLLCVPSLYGVLLDAAERLGTARLGSLDTVIVAGEALPAELMRRHFFLHSGAVALVNEYGPTETTVWASYHRFDAPGPVSIGRPIPGARLYVLDDQLRPTPPGVQGELFIGGAGVSRGYVDRPEATAHAFLDDPFAGAPGARMYRTGDLARWNQDGTLAFLGRRDQQVKIRGHRVELGAVEAQLRALPQVRDAVVVPNGTDTGLVGFVLAPTGCDPRALRAHLADRLPAAMVPARIAVLDDFPRTVNGKVDRSALRERAEPPPAAPAQDSSAPPPPPDEPPPDEPTAPAEDSALTARVAAAWAEVLTASEVPTEVNFFDLGGHSLAMFTLQDALERHTGKRPSVVALFRHTTVAAQAALIRDGDGGTETETETEAALSGTWQASGRRARALQARRQRAEREAAT